MQQKTGSDATPNRLFYSFFIRYIPGTSLRRVAAKSSEI